MVVRERKQYNIPWRMKIEEIIGDKRIQGGRETRKSNGQLKKGFIGVFAILFIMIYYCKESNHPLNKTQRISCKANEIAI